MKYLSRFVFQCLTISLLKAAHHHPLSLKQSSQQLLRNLLAVLPLTALASFPSPSLSAVNGEEGDELGVRHELFRSCNDQFMFEGCVSSQVPRFLLDTYVLLYT